MAQKRDGSIDLLTVEKLVGMKFRIPSYQRGYRWRKQHVDTLLNYLELFSQELEGEADSPRVYSLQPLVVKRTVPTEKKQELLDKLKGVEGVDVAEELFEEYWEWEVIDGQQRLTTLFLILMYLQCSNIYSITYDTRISSKLFLERFAHVEASMKDEAKTNIDFCRMYEVYGAIEKWFEDKDQAYRSKFAKLIFERVQFIWYESVGEKAIEVFTRLNIGNIKLTDAELIKALILDQSSFLDATGQHYRDDAQLKLARGKISAEWDAIERRLQDDSFWLYLQPYDEKKKEPPTRIDFLLQQVAARAPLRDVVLDESVHDEHELFHRYEKFFRAHRSTPAERMDARKQIWSLISDVYHVLEEWFEDSKLYHYTGYLMAVENKRIIVGSLLNDWYERPNRGAFVQKLEERMKTSLNGIRDYARDQSVQGQQPKTILDVVYDSDGCPAKANCKRLLLLHNVLTVIQLGEFMADNALYRGQRVYYKFPFNLYKREDWEIEHVDPHTDNAMEKRKDQIDWLMGTYPYMSDQIKERIISFCGENPNNEEFSNLRDECSALVEQGIEHLENDEKNMIWNFVLLDGGTNSSYGNSLFPAKRRTIMFKEQGVKLKNFRFSDPDANGVRKVEWDEEPATSPFVPLCTKQVFLQYYSSTGVSPLVWSKNDAQSYYDNMKKVLQRFL